MDLILSFYLSFSWLFSYSKQHCSAIQEPVCGNSYFPWMKITLILLVLPSNLSLLPALHPCSWPDLHCEGKAGSFCPLSFHDSYKYLLLTNAPVSMLEDRGNRLRNHTVLNGRRKVPKKKKTMEKSYRDMPDCVYWSSHYEFHFCFRSCDSVLFGDAAKINMQSIISPDLKHWIRAIPQTQLFHTLISNAITTAMEIFPSSYLLSNDILDHS